MITFDKAFELVMQHSTDFGNEIVPLMQSMHRVLCEDILADRDFPPFDRATKDGIAIDYAAIETGRKRFEIQGILSAGTPEQRLSSADNCFEIMTGAVVPENSDTVIMYEEVTIEDGVATIQNIPKQGQNIHGKGSDKKKGTVLISRGKRIDAAEIGVLASVGKTNVSVKRVPKICVISTGNELVDISETPLSHQIRKSNTLSLEAALSKEGISCQQLHLKDDRHSIEIALKKAVNEYDVLLVSGGVSKGKYDFIPEVLEVLGVKKVFHRVAQRPGKPFWFGVHQKEEAVIFSFPGNPVSTFANYHIYFLPWLYKSWRLPTYETSVVLEEQLNIAPHLTRFIQVQTYIEKGTLKAKPIYGNGSGDQTSLVRSDGFVCLRPRDTPYEIGDAIPFIKVR